MRNSVARGILVTGIHRSGTTWIGKMLSLGNGVICAFEPFNVERLSYKLNGLAHCAYAYIPELDEDEAFKAFEKVLHNKTRKVFSRKDPNYWLPFLRHGRVIVKDATAAMSSEWLYQHFDLDVVVLIRHPAAYVASLMRMNWDFPFENFLSQDKLMENELFPFKKEIESVGDDFIEKAALSWKCIYFVLTNYIKRNNWIVKRHEDLSRNPVEELKKLYVEVGLEWNEKIRDKIQNFTASSNPTTAKEGVAHQLKRDSKNLVYKWKEKLTKEQVQRIKRITDPVSQFYYDDDDW